MLSILLVAIAAAMFFGVDAAKLKSLVEAVKAKVDSRTAIAVGLVLLALVLMPRGSHEPSPAPEPDAGPFSLKGVFLGPSASEDAALVGALCEELADEIEFDGTQSDPYLKSGVAVDELRKAARVLRCRGISIGDRQPTARDAIATYLDQNVGTDGGPLTPEQRAAWVRAFRDIGGAACDAAE